MGATGASDATICMMVGVTYAFADPYAATVCADTARLVAVRPRPEVGVRVADDGADDDKPIGIEAAAKLTGISRWTIARAAEDGELAHLIVGRRHRRFRPSDLAAWKKARERPASFEGRLSALEERVDRLERGE